MTVPEARTQGWFYHPWNFDPLWVKDCADYLERVEDNEIVFRGVRIKADE